jgi:large subunit ribosomal protein L4e
MEKVNIYNLDGQSKGSIEVPSIFKFKPRLDLVQIASEAFITKNKQKQGRDKRAGLRNTAEGWGTGHAMSRAPRIKGSGFQTARNVGRVPFAKGGRIAHPIKNERKIIKKLNSKVKKLSIYSAISASGQTKWLENRGHIISDVPQIPLVIDDKVQTIKKTKDIFLVLCELGLKKELLKTKKAKKVRAGKGKRRGRKYKSSKGPLLVIKEDYGIIKAIKNIPGLDAAKIENLSIDLLAPGAMLGRFVIWTQSAFNELNNYF